MAFHPDGQWCVTARYRDGSGGHNWWGGVDGTASSGIKEWFQKGSRLQVVFGGDKMCFLLSGVNGYWDVGDTRVPSSLIKRVQKRHQEKGTVEFVRLWDESAYFVSDDKGTQWENVGQYLTKELRGDEKVNDVSLAGDWQWIVIRPTRYTASQGVASKLTKQLTNFYADQRSRRERRNAQIAEHDKRLQQEKERRDRKAREEQARREGKHSRCGSGKSNRRKRPRS